jgi:cysteinyl-tRNA synthetase
MPDYGRLAKRSLDEMVAGARVEVAPYKHDPTDCVLWKPSKPGEPAWPSPAGIAAPGRPGWHLECSAMSWKHLGETFDIHGGGIDLVFPHHENEIAQSRCAFHTPVMANYWMHNGFLQVEGDKMSKSLGNFVTIRELLDGWQGKSWPGEVLRFSMLRTHYRQPIDWTVRALDESLKTLSNWYEKVQTVEPQAELAENFLEALCDDLNTPRAIADLHSLDRSDDLPKLSSALNFLGFSRDQTKLQHKVFLSATAFLMAQAKGTLSVDATVNAPGLDPKKIDKLVADRNAARKARNFAESDRIRDELAAMGVVLKDTKDGTTWEIAR